MGEEEIEEKEDEEDEAVCVVPFVQPSAALWPRAQPWPSLRRTLPPAWGRAQTIEWAARHSLFG